MVGAGLGIILWITVGASAGWLAGRIIGTEGRPGAPAFVFIGILGALAAGSITRVVLARLGFRHLDIAGVVGALFGTCAMVFGSHADARRHANDPPRRP